MERFELPSASVTRTSPPRRLFPGCVDAGTGGITADDPGHPEVDDVLDDLGEIVLREGGGAIVIPADRMPTDTGAAAMCRF